VTQEPQWRLLIKIVVVSKLFPSSLLFEEIGEGRFVGVGGFGVSTESPILLGLTRVISVRFRPSDKIAVGILGNKRGI